MRTLLVLTVLFFSSVSLASRENLHCQRGSDSEPCNWVALDEALRAPVDAVLKELSKDLGKLVARISKVQVVDHFTGTASIGPTNPAQLRIDGYTLVLSRKAIEFKDDASSFLTWKESLFLTGVSSAELPQIELAVPMSQHPGLYYIILHELGHVAWYEHGVDQVACLNPVMTGKPYWEAAFFLEAFLSKNPAKTYKDLDCSYTLNSFLSQSWKNEWTFDEKNRLVVSRLAEFDVQELSKICFYGCSKPAAWTRDELRALYSKLYLKTPFMTVYSAYFKPEEDFAESFALYYLRRSEEASYKLTLATGESYDLLRKVDAEIFREKRQLLESVFENLKSPQLDNSCVYLNK